MKNIYSIQPYEVGAKNHKSLAIIIPSEVKKECDIDTSSIFFLEVNRKLKRIYISGPADSSILEDVESGRPDGVMAKLRKVVRPG